MRKLADPISRALRKVNMNGSLALQIETPRRLALVLMDQPEPAHAARPMDSLILAVAQDRDRRAFAALFEHFAPRLKSYLTRLGAPPHQAEELAQEALVTVWRKASLFDPSCASAATWIFRIARNLRLDCLRREAAPAAYVPDLSEAADPPATPEHAELKRQRDERLRAALAGLSSDHLQVLRLSFFQDRPHAEIAETLCLPLGTVKSRIRLALEKLRGALECEQ